MILKKEEACIENKQPLEKCVLYKKINDYTIQSIPYLISKMLQKRGFNYKTPAVKGKENLPPS